MICGGGGRSGSSRSSGGTAVLNGRDEVNLLFQQWSQTNTGHSAALATYAGLVQSIDCSTTSTTTTTSYEVLLMLDEAAYS